MNPRPSSPRSLTQPFSLVALTALLLLSVGCSVIEMGYLNSREITELQVVDDSIYMGHEINSKTLDQFEAVMAANPGLKTLVLTYVPGSVDDEINLQLGRRVRELGLATHVVAGGMIASGGVDLFLAGKERTMEHGAYVGVHSWAMGFGKTGKDVPRDDPAHQMYLDYYDAIEIPQDFYWFTLQAPADSLHWMSAAEMERFDMLTAPLQKAGAADRPFAEVVAEVGENLKEEGATPVSTPSQDRG